MEKPVNGIDSVFFRDLTRDYLENHRNSFLYRDFWGEKMQELLEEHFPELLKQEPPKPEDAKRLMKGMREAMNARPEWARKLLLMGDKKRRNMFAEFWLNDAGYRTGIITDTEYYLWLAEYLAAHDFFKAGIIYSKEASDEEPDKGDRRETIDGCVWLVPLLLKGLDMDFEGLKQELKARGVKGKKAQPLSKEEAYTALAMLAERIREDRDGVAGRLHDLKVKDKLRNKDRDYLPWLTARLKWQALHINIREWMQNRGYSLTVGEEKGKPKKARNKEITWRRFTAFCDSEEGYDFRRKNGRGWDWDNREGGYSLDTDGFCILDTLPEQLDELMEAHAKAQDEDGPLTYLYIPLAVHMRTGCVFFLAGKSYYENVYEAASGNGKKGKELLARYQAARKRYCFDYMRQDQAMGGSFRLAPAFHVNAGKSYWDIREEFEDYCMSIDRGGPLHRLTKTNGPRPEAVPEEFYWAFDPPEPK